MQPAWRDSMEGMLSCEQPLEAKASDWDDVRIGNRQGLLLVVMALSWWLAAVPELNDRFIAAVQDVQWVLSELILLGQNPPSSVKRSLDASDDSRISLTQKR